jgi:hypothetical protein
MRTAALKAVMLPEMNAAERQKTVKLLSYYSCQSRFDDCPLWQEMAGQ